MAHVGCHDAELHTLLMLDALRVASQISAGKLVAIS